MIYSLFFFATFYLFSLNFTDKNQWPRTAIYTITLSTLFLYLCAVLGYYQASHVILTIVLLIGAILGLRKKSAITPNISEWAALLIILIAAVLPYFYNLQLDLWDEFSHWGTVQKVLKITRSLSVDTTYDMGASYIQGLSIWIDLLSSSNVKYEYSLYSGTSTFLLSFFFLTVFLLIYEYFDSSSSRIIPFLILIYFFLFLCEKALDSAYTIYALYVDFPLAVFLTGAALSLLLTDMRTSFALVLCSCVLLTVTKHTGLYFSATSIFLWLVIFWGRTSSKILLKLAAVLLTTILICKFAWDWHLSLNDIPKYFNENRISIKTFLNFLVNPSSDILFFNILNKMISSLKENYLFMYSAIAMTLASVTYVTLRRSFPFRYVFAYIFSLGSYLLLLLLSYRFLFTSYEADRIASFSRYINTMIFAWCLFPTAWILIQNKKNVVDIGKNRVLLYSISASMIYFTFSQLTTHISIADQKIDVRQPIRILADKVKNQVGPKDRIFLIWQYSDGFHYHISKYEFYPNKIDNDIWSFGKPSSEKDVWTYQLSLEEFKSKIKEYPYILVASEEGSLWEDYGILFDKKSLGLFKVVILNEDNLILKHIEL